jgi:Ca2+-binding RTX toxin-like protein
VANPINGTIDPDLLDGTVADDEIFGFEGDDIIDGGDGNDVIVAGADDDIVTIASGVDSADGGDGNDELRIDYSAAGLTGTLTIDLRNMIGNGAGTIKYGTLTGNLTHFESITLLTGSTAKDTIYLGSNFVDSLISMYAGDDKFVGSQWYDQVSGGGGNDTLLGGGGDDILYGDNGNDTLNGGADEDIMYGGQGNDIYIVDNVFDWVSELNLGGTDAGGTDIVRTSVDYSLNAFVENLFMTGDGGLYGSGNGLANTITGNTGDNWIEGQGGNDILYGMAGDDVIYGGGGNDAINGGGGDDSMYGGGGNDTFIVDSSLDYVSETTVLDTDAGGTDLVKSSVSFELGDYIEKLTLTGTQGIDGTGNDLANTIFGNSGANALYGLAGNDIITGGGGADTVAGGAGADILTGGGGPDIFYFDVVETGANRDTIKDFVSGTDAIFFDSAAFTALDGLDAEVDDSFFAVGTSATAAEHRLIFNPTNHVLIYDVDGVGGLAGVQVAVLTNGASIAATDIHIMDSSLPLV